MEMVPWRIEDILNGLMHINETDEEVKVKRRTLGSERKSISRCMDTYQSFLIVLGMPYTKCDR